MLRSELIVTPRLERAPRRTLEWRNHLTGTPEGLTLKLGSMFTLVSWTVFGSLSWLSAPG